MALARCKACKNQIAKTAKTCPSCGAPNKKTSRAVKLAFIMVALAVFGAYVTDGGSGRTVQPELSPEKMAQIKQEAKERAEKSFNIEAQLAAERAVRRLLKDPDSAQFKSVYVTNREKTGRSACGLVNSKNSFGGMAGFKRFVSDGKTTFMEGRDSNFAQVWAAACST